MHQRWVTVRSILHKNLVEPLSIVSFPVEERIVTKHRKTILETRLIDTNPCFRFLNDSIEWCKEKLKILNCENYGSDLEGIESEINKQKKVNEEVLKFSNRIQKCMHEKNNFDGNDLILYDQYLVHLKTYYADLTKTSTTRLSDLKTLQEFIESASSELLWLSNKEEIEMTRNWAETSNTSEIEKHYEVLKCIIR